MLRVLLESDITRFTFSNPLSGCCVSTGWQGRCQKLGEEVGKQKMPVAWARDGVNTQDIPSACISTMCSSAKCVQERIKEELEILSHLDGDKCAEAAEGGREGKRWNKDLHFDMSGLGCLCDFPDFPVRCQVGSRKYGSS